MNNNDLVCCEPVRTISDNEREISEILEDCVSTMSEFLRFVDNSDTNKTNDVGVNCFKENVLKNLEYARILRTQINDLRRLF